VEGCKRQWDCAQTRGTLHRHAGGADFARRHSGGEGECDVDSTTTTAFCATTHVHYVQARLGHPYRPSASQETADCALDAPISARPRRRPSLFEHLPGHNSSTNAFHAKQTTRPNSPDDSASMGVETVSVGAVLKSVKNADFLCFRRGDAQFPTNDTDDERETSWALCAITRERVEGVAVVGTRLSSKCPWKSAGRTKNEPAIPLMPSSDTLIPSPARSLPPNSKTAWGRNPFNIAFRTNSGGGGRVAARS